MIAALQTRFDHLERHKQRVVARLETLGPSQAHLCPQPGAWSALEVLDHLVKVELACLNAVRKTLPDGVSVPFAARCKAYGVIAAMRLPVRVKVPPQASAVVPDTSPEFATLAPLWAQVRRDMSELLDSLNPGQCERGLFRHPVSGWMTMPTAITFLTAHIRHHEYQLDRIHQALPARHRP